MRRRLVGFPVVVVCLGFVASCGGGERGGYVASGGSPSAKAVAPRGGVSFAPLPSSPEKQSRESKQPREPSGPRRSASERAAPSSSPVRRSPRGGGSAAPPASAPTSSASRSPSGGGSGESGRPGPGASHGSPGPAGPAVLEVGAPVREAGARRWCEDVTLVLRNRGGADVRSGTVEFGTHIIGALGVDWGSVESTVKLPAPLRGGQSLKKTWPVCVDAWRVPWGMHVETRDVDVDWR
ncbi:hypothetical protein FH965_19160 [Streptomyces spectabilis]|uniref:Uncharacterized protein n=1 Tax=Streptomyces spectabilis TaxID=68270 RepID=A0A516R9T2_STRST|nr:hypothetical protein FH965_19160 [Streptomyces spectabilis]